MSVVESTCSLAVMNATPRQIASMRITIWSTLSPNGGVYLYVT